MSAPQVVEYLHTTGLKTYSRWVRAVGFKLFYEWQGEQYAGMWEVFRQNKALKVIHLKRRNHLRTLVSLTIAQNNKRWSQGIQEVQTPSLSKAVVLGVDECKRHFLGMEEEEKRHDEFFANHSILEVYYEDLVAQPQLELAQVQQFLGVKNYRLVTLLARQNPEPLSALILNFSELETAFQGTQWHHFFTETEGAGLSTKLTTNHKKHGPAHYQAF